jgi:hypothetical protein
VGWRRRLVELAAAGGVLASGGCFFDSTPTCNANPDPCCSEPDGPVCAKQHACLAAPTATCCQTDAFCGMSLLACDPLADNDFDGNGPLDRPGTACAGPAIGCYPNDMFGLQQFECDIALAGAEDLRHGASPISSDRNACAQGYVPLTFVDVAGGNTVECHALCAPGEAYLGNPSPQTPNGIAPHRCSPADALGAFGTPASGTTNGEHCMYAWRLIEIQNRFVPADPKFDAFGLCVDHTRFQYDANGDGVPDTAWPACATLPLHDPTANTVDATALGCVSSTTARSAAAIHTRLVLPLVPVFARR